MKVKYIFFYSLLLIITTIGVCFAKPEISDNYPHRIADGDTITISGTGFTVKTTTVPLSCDNNKGETDGQEFSATGYYNEDSSRYLYTDDNSHSKGVSIKTTIKRWPDGSLLFYDMGAEGTDEVYFTFWARIDFLVGDDSDGAQIKWMAIRAEKNQTQSGYGFYPWYWKVDGAFEWQTQAAGVVYNDYVVDGVNWIDSAPTENTWFRVEMYGKRASGANVADGTWKVKVLEPDDNRVVTITDNTKQITHGSDDGTWRYVGWRNEITNSDNTGSMVDMWIDDIYIDNSQARIEIGNNSDFEKCTHREIQIPASWSETNIEFEFNQASFDEGDNVYLFVVDENGNTSNGYPITIGGDNSLTFDVNDDGQVNVLDVIMCVNIVLDNDTGNADVNGDGKTNVQDVTAVVNDILGV